MGIVLSKDWNRAAMARHVWELAKINNMSLWANWGKVNRLRQKSLWEVKAINDCLL